MKQKLRMLAYHQTATSLQRTDNLNPRSRRYSTLDESNRMKSACFTILHPGKHPPPQNGSRLKSVSLLKAPVSHPPTFAIQPDFPWHQPAAITLNTGGGLGKRAGQEEGESSELGSSGCSLARGRGRGVLEIPFAPHQSSVPRFFFWNVGDES